VVCDGAGRSEYIQGEPTRLACGDPHFDRFAGGEKQRLDVSHANLFDDIRSRALDRAAQYGYRETAERLERVKTLKRFQKFAMNLRLGAVGVDRRGGRR
jgi:hypothetical protein